MGTPGAGKFHARFDGQDVDSNCILVKYTWNGDMNVDGVVNAEDYFLIDSAFLGQMGPLAVSNPEKVQAAPGTDLIVYQRPQRREPEASVLAQLFSNVRVL